MICPVCRSLDFQNFLTTKDFFLSQEEFQIARCSSCGLLITESAPDEENIGGYYRSENYISHSDAHQNFMLTILYRTARWIMFQKKYHIIRKFHAENGRLLDVGCGTGHFAGFMKNKGWQVMGVEADLASAQSAKNMYGISVISPTEYLNQSTPGAFTLVTLWHVLEHIHRITETLTKIHSDLNKEGTLMIAVPNPESYDAEYFGKFWAAWDVPRHLWHFPPDTLIKFITKYGFDCLKITPLPMDVFYVSLLSAGYRKKNKPVDFLISSLKGSVLCLKEPRRCSSLLYVFKKK